MKRFIASLAALVALSVALSVTAQGQESYPSNQQTTTTQTTTDPATQTQTQTTTTDQTTTDNTMTSDNTMPATASPLPVIGIGGILALAAAALLPRRRRNA